MLLLRAHVLALGHSGVRPERDRPHGLDAERGRDPRRAPAGVARGLGRPGAAREPRAAADRPRGGAHAPRAAPEPAAAAMARAGLAPLTLEAKEGLALVNGTQGMLAIGILATERAAIARPHRRRRRGDDDRGLARHRPARSTSGCRRCGRIPASRRAPRTCGGCSPGLADPRLAPRLARTSCRTRTRCGAPRRCTARPATRSPTRAACCAIEIEQRERQPDRAARRR